MIKKVIWCFLLHFCMFYECAISAQPANINVSLTSLFEGEPYIAINPANPNNIVIAWMADDASTNFRISIKSKTSFDGGQTWGNPSVRPHFGASWSSADVSMQFRANGTLYLSYIDSRQSPDSGGVYVSHSINGGTSWSTPTQAWNALLEDPTKLPLDRPWLIVDNSGGVNDGSFYMTTKPAPWISPPNRAYLKTSTDSGQTWNAFRYVDTANFLIGNFIAAPMAAPTVAADGAFCIAYPSYMASQSIYPKMLFAKSYNKGASFQYHDLIVNPTPLAAADSSFKAGYHLTANPVNANQLAFIAVSANYGDPDIFVSTTNDGGITWSNLVRVNDDAIGNGIGQDMPWGSYDSNNRLVVVWRDRRNGAGVGYAQNTDTYSAVSINNGQTFQSNVRLSSASAPFANILLQNGNDFMGCELLNDTIYAAWGDTRTGSLNIFFAKASVLTGNVGGITTVNSEDEQEFTLSPNPSSGLLFIRSNKNQKGVTLALYDANGKNILNKKLEIGIEPIPIDFGRLNDGVFFIEISNRENVLFKKKLIVQKEN